MTALSIRAAVASLGAIAIAGCTTSGIGTGQSIGGNLGATFSWTETGGTQGTMVAQLSNGQVFQGPMFQITSEARVDYGPLWNGWGPGWGWGGGWGGRRWGAPRSPSAMMSTSSAIFPAADTLARIVRRGQRRTVLRRTADDTDPTERVFVANADQLLIVVALADPPPRTGLVERALIAAYAGGLEPILCLTKTDLAPAEPFAAQFADLDLTITTAGRDDPLDGSRRCWPTRSPSCWAIPGCGKSTLVNRLVPEADRATGEVTDIGKGRHTSTQSVALPLKLGGWVIDTRASGRSAWPISNPTT